MKEASLSRLRMAHLLRNIEVLDPSSPGWKGGPTDTAYAERNKLILELLALAPKLGLDAGIRFDPTEPDWPVVYVELETGQVSWHLPQHRHPYDGHDTATKYQRSREQARRIDGFEWDGS